MSGKEPQQFAVVGVPLPLRSTQICQPNSQWFWVGLLAVAENVTAVLRRMASGAGEVDGGHEVVGLAGQRHVAQYRAKGGLPTSAG